MDEPLWPFWKFDMKRDDLTTTLHDRFNTFPSAIQDPEAFHHDVYEISTHASTLDEFERLMEERKKQRLDELNTTLEDASFEIIGNTSLIGTDQWQYAVQLFRTRSLDSLVRYFASYLPQDHPWHHDAGATIRCSSNLYDSVYDGDNSVVYDEPEEDDSSYGDGSSHPFTSNSVLSNQPGRSMTASSEDSGVSVTDLIHHHKPHDGQASERAMSFFGSEPDHVSPSMHGSVSSLHEYDGTSQSDDPGTPSTCISETSDAEEVESYQTKHMLLPTVADSDTDAFFSSSEFQAVDGTGSKASTPKPKPVGSVTAKTAPLFDTRLSSLRSREVSHAHPHYAHDAYHQNRTTHPAVRQCRRMDSSLDRKRARLGSQRITKASKVSFRAR